MDMERVPIGAVVGSGILVLASLTSLPTVIDAGGLSVTVFAFGVLALGIFGLFAAFARAEGSPGGALERRLQELDRLKDDGTLTATEHRRKRKELVDAWGLPPEGAAATN